MGVTVDTDRDDDEYDMPLAGRASGGSGTASHSHSLDDVFMPLDAAANAAAAAARFAGADGEAERRDDGTPYRGEDREIGPQSATACTRTVRRSLNPRFEEELLLTGVSPRSPLVFTIIDDDARGPSAAAAARVPHDDARYKVNERHDFLGQSIVCFSERLARDERARRRLVRTDNAVSRFLPEAGAHELALAVGPQRVYQVRLDRRQPQLLLAPMRNEHVMRVTQIHNNAGTRSAAAAEGGRERVASHSRAMQKTVAVATPTRSCVSRGVDSRSRACVQTRRARCADRSCAACSVCSRHTCSSQRGRCSPKRRSACTIILSTGIRD